MQQREHPKRVQTITFQKNEKYKLIKITFSKKIENRNAKTTYRVSTYG